MTTNPYAAPALTSDPVDRAEHEIRSVIRVFRILSIFAIVVALVAVLSAIHALISYGSGIRANVVIIVLHLAMIAVAVPYLRVAARMSQRELRVAKWSRRLSLLMILTFPLFPYGLSCFPVFPLAGILCFRKTGRYYSAYCGAQDLLKDHGRRGEVRQS